MRGLASLVLCAVLLAPAWGRDAEGDYKAQGLGADTCISFLTTGFKDRGLYFSWIAGYLTAYNYLVRDTYSIAEYSGLSRTNAWLEDYCNSHPDHLLHRALKQFVTDNYRVRLKTGPKQ